SFGRIPSENRYADLDDDGLPDLAIGRLPVQTAEQALAVAEKVIGQQASLQAHAGRHVIAVDNSLELDPPFRQEPEDLAATLPAGSLLAWADVGDGIVAARSALRGSWQGGAAVTHYFGHGGAELWADEDLLAADEVPALDGHVESTVLLTWGCEAQW